MERSSILNTIEDLSRPGGLDVIGHQLKLFQVIKALIISSIPSDEINNSGKYQIEGDASNLLDLTSKYTITNRSFSEVDNFTFKSITYLPDLDVTELELNLLAGFRTNGTDKGFQVCLVIELSNTNVLKSINTINNQMYEDNTFGNISSSNFSFTINDENKAFYNNITKKGFFYTKNVITEVDGVEQFSDYKYQSGMKSTFVRVKSLQNYIGSDFKHGKVEFVTGAASGENFLILDTNYNNLKLNGLLAPHKFEAPDTTTKVSKGDKVRVSYSNEFYVSLQVWSRDHIAEKFSIFLGMLDLNTLDINDTEKTITVSAFSKTKDLYAKNLGDLEFETGPNLFRLPEIKLIHGSNNTKRLRPIVRREKEEQNTSITIEEVAFDISKGWHFVDFDPSSNLFRFDFGTWYQVLDEGSFEASTNSIFLPSMVASANSPAKNWPMYPSVLPNHSLDITINQEIEKKWNGGWARISIATEEATFIGATNGAMLNNGNGGFKKLSNLPTQPTRISFYVNEDRSIAIQTQFEYSFDSGTFKEPVLMFDRVTSSQDDCTYRANFGFQNEADYSVAVYPTTGEEIDFFAYRKFNGILLRLNNLPTETDVYPERAYKNKGYKSIISDLLQHTSFALSTGEEDFGKSINTRFVGGTTVGAVAIGITNLELTLKPADTYTSLVGLYDNLSNMRLMLLDGDNFLESRLISSSAIVNDTIPFVVSIALTEGFSSAIDASTKFVIINKALEINFVDYGDSLKDGELPDAIVIEKSSPMAEGVYYQNWFNTMNGSGDIYFKNTIRNGDALYLGHRERFQDFTFCLNYLSDVDDTLYKDLAWSTKNPKFGIEYFNGINWSSAENISIIPTTISDGIKESNIVKFLVHMDTVDWNTGYAIEHTSIAADKIFAIRVSYLSGVPAWISNPMLSNNSELSMVVTWEDIDSWSPNTFTRINGKILADNFQPKILTQTMYGLRVKAFRGRHIIRSAQPVNKFEGFGGENYYAVLDWDNIDLKYWEDIFNISSKGLLTTFPKDISFLHLLKESASSINKGNVDFRIHKDSFTDFNENYASIVGSGYDGVLPIDVGWDRAFVTENLNNYFNGSNPGYSFKQVSVIRVNETYFAFALIDDGSNVLRFESTDLKTWTYKAPVYANTGTALINGICVVKNTEQDDYRFWISASPNPTTDIFILWSHRELTITTYDLGAILADPSNVKSPDFYHTGQISAIYPCVDASLIIFEAYDNATLGAGLPSGNIRLESRGSLDDDNSATFDITTDYGFNTPTFIKADVSIQGETFAPAFSSDVILLCKNTTDDLCKLTPIENSNRLSPDYSFTVPDIIKEGISLKGFAAVVNGLIYNYNDPADGALTLCRPYLNNYLLIGIDQSDSTQLKGAALDSMAKSYSEESFIKEVTNIYNEEDWFKTFNNETILEEETDSQDYRRLYLGSREKFDKILPNFITSDFTSEIGIRYWDGSSWVNLERIYQNGRLLKNSKFKPIFGFYFDIPTDWKSEVFDNVISNTTFPIDTIKTNSESLFWVEIYVPNTGAVVPDKTIAVKSFRNCFTNLFAYKGKQIYMMKNWDYFKQVFTIPYEKNKDYKVDSLAFDRDSKCILVICVDVNNYQYKDYEVYPIDMFGNIKDSYKLWSGEKFKVIDGRPEATVRTGAVARYNSTDGNKAEVVIGNWDQDFLYDRFGGTSGYTAFNGIGSWNLPIPKEQIVRMGNGRNMDWSTSFDATFIGDANISRRSDKDKGVIGTDDNFASMVKALTNSGLLWEELVNAPLAKLMPGYYGFAERSYQTKHENVGLSFEGFESTPITPVGGDRVIIVSSDASLGWEENANTIGYWIAANAAWQFSTPYRGLIVEDSTDSNQLYVWNGFKWEEITDTKIWDGRSVYYGLKLNIISDMDNNPVRIPFLRGYGTRPEIYSNNDVNRQDEKLSISYRDINVDSSDFSFIYGKAFGELGLRPTCAVLLPDLSAIKDSIAATAYGDKSLPAKIYEPSAPAIAFGSYMFRDYDSFASGENDNALREFGDIVYPYGISSINLLKLGGKVKNWKYVTIDNYAWEPDQQRLDCMNYKLLRDNPYQLPISNSGSAQFCLPARFFSISFNASNLSSLTFQYLKSDGTWANIPNVVQSVNPVSKGLVDNERWSYKTLGGTATWNPFINDWKPMVNDTKTGYWIRLSNPDPVVVNKLYWAVASGICLMDSMRWWEDYNIELENPATDEGKRQMDSYVPMSIEYDKINKLLIGSVWDFSAKVNKYYPIKIAFDKADLYKDSQFYWSWNTNEEIEILNNETDINYSYNIKSIANVSNMDSKALLVDQSDKTKAPIVANIKSVRSGDNLFQFGIG